MTIAARASEGSGIGWGLAKNSPYLEIFNRGYNSILLTMVGNHFELLIFLNIRTLELFETGLISLWSNWFPSFNVGVSDRKDCLSAEEKSD